jgi:hypothetical protein
MRKAYLCAALAFAVACTSGCEAFVRKFTRKSNKKEAPEELVLQPQEYALDITPEEAYRKYYLFASSWLDESAQALVPDGNRKKQLYSLDEAMRSLTQCRQAVNEEGKKKLDNFITRIGSVRAALANDVYARNLSWHRDAVAGLKRDLWKQLAFPKMAEYMEPQK